ncbi:MAG: hypothetical protein AAF501_05410 [Pseudomonadota bacterium]
MKHPRKHKLCRLRGEQLEDRRVLAIFTVTGLGDPSTNPTGMCEDRNIPSLREAVKLANSCMGPDIINFNNLSGTITLDQSSAIRITDDLIINGELMGTRGGAGPSLTIDAMATTTRIFTIDDSSPTPIEVTIKNLSLANGGGVNDTMVADANDGLGGALFSRERDLQLHLRHRSQQHPGCAGRRGCRVRLGL